LRVEGIHIVLKEYLKRSDLNLFEVWRVIKQVLFNQFVELRANQAKQQIRIPIDLSKSLFNIIYGWISYETLRKVEEQRKLLEKDPLPPCINIFTRSFGLPCVYTIQDLLIQQQPLQLHHFHSHWYLQRTGEL